MKGALRAAAVAVSIASTAVAQSFNSPASGSFPVYSTGQPVEISWSSPWDYTLLDVYQGPISSGGWVYTQLTNASSSTTSYTWGAASLPEASLDGQYFFFRLVNGQDLTQFYDSTDFSVVLAAATASSVSSSPSSTSSEASSVTSASTSASETASITSSASLSASSPAPTTMATSASSSEPSHPFGGSSAPAATSASSSASGATTGAAAQPNYLGSFLGVGLGVGIPVLLAAIAGVWIWLRNKRKMSRESIALEKGRGAP